MSLEGLTAVRAPSAPGALKKGTPWLWLVSESQEVDSAAAHNTRPRTPLSKPPFELPVGHVRDVVSRCHLGSPVAPVLNPIAIFNLPIPSLPAIAGQTAMVGLSFSVLRAGVSAGRIRGLTPVTVGLAPIRLLKPR